MEYALIVDDFQVAIQAGGNRLLHTTLGSYGVSAGIGVQYLNYALHYGFGSDISSGGEFNPDVSLGIGHRISVIVGF